MKQSLTTILLFIAMMSSVAQERTIRGKVVDNDKNPLVGVNVLLKENEKGAETDFDGNFEIQNVDGKFTLVISYIGFKTKEIIVNAPANLQEIILYEGNELLQEIVIEGERKNKFSRKKTAYVSKLPLKDLENSHVYSTITSELLESQVITNLDDALNNATGISKLWEATGRDPGRGTGYFSTRGFNVQSQFVDGVPGVTLSAVDPSYIERIEVIKGPTATLFGSTFTSLGGLINIVTKKPYKGFGANVTYTAGSFGLNRVSADVNTEIGNNKSTYFRINTSFLTQDSFQDAGFRETFFVAPSLTHRASNKFNLTFGLEYSRTKQTNASMLFLRRGLPLVSTNIDQLNVDPNKSLTSNDLFLTSPVFTSRVIGDYKISDQWTSQTIFASTYAESKGYYQYNTDGAGVAILQLAPVASDPNIGALVSPFINPMLAEANALLQRDLFTRIIDKRDAKANNYNLQQNFIGDFKIGNLRNRMVVGLDYVNQSEHSKNKSGNPAIIGSSNFPQLLGFLGNPPTPPIPAQFVPTLQGVGQTIQATYTGLPYFDAFFDAQGNIVNTSFTPNAVASPTRAQLAPIFDQIQALDVETRSQTFATYISNVLNVTDNLTINVGLRLDYFDQDGNRDEPLDDYTKTTFSPSAGILFQPIKNKVSLFTNYQTGFVNVNPIVNQDGSVATFQPQRARQFEGGVKTNLFNGKLNIGASYYHITVNDRPTSDPRVPLIPITIAIDEVVSKGIELEVNASPIQGLSLRASYSYNDSKITETSILELQDRRPEESGPEAVYNFWADYQFQEGSPLENFGIGAGFNGASNYYTINNGVSGQFELPAYTIYNASLYYDAKKFRIGVKANNITDKVYYRGWSTINPQAPRAFLGTLAYKF